MIREQGSVEPAAFDVAGGTDVRHVAAGAGPLPARAGRGFDVLRYVLAVIVLAAAALKVHQLVSGPPPAGDGFQSSRAAQAVAVEVELFLGVWLLSGAFPRALWAAALVSFAAFGVVATSRALDGQASCGCFGRVTVNPWITAGLDLAAVIALVLFPPGPSSAGNRSGQPDGRRRAAVALASWLVLGSAAAILIVRQRPPVVDGVGGEDVIGTASFVVLEPESWVGKRFPLTEHIDVGRQLATGRWVVAFYRHDCNHCREEMPQLERRAREAAQQGDGPRVALVSIPPHADPGQDIVTPETACKVGRLNAEREWFMQTPAEVSVEDGVVTSFHRPQHP